MNEFTFIEANLLSSLVRHAGRQRRGQRCGMGSCTSRDMGAGSLPVCREVSIPCPSGLV